MSIGKITLFTVLVIFFVSNANSDKRRTASRIFTKLKAGGTKNCRFIERDFIKLKGIWNFILRTVTSKNAPEICCGHLVVTDASKDGFDSEVEYLTHKGAIVRKPIAGLFINDTVVGIPQLNNFVTVDPAFSLPFFAEMGICDNDTIFFIEPIHYHGGGMVFTRDIPDNIIPLKLRFGTFDERMGKERTVKVPHGFTAK